MDPLIGVIAFIVLNALFHESASSQFALVREAQSGGLNPIPLPGSSVQIAVILGNIIYPLSGVAALFIAFHDYKALACLPPLLCWYIGFQAFRKVANPQLKQLMACWGVVVIPYLLWVLVIRMN